MDLNIEPCGCGESDALRTALEEVVASEGCGDCLTSEGYCCFMGRYGKLLAHLKKKRAEMREHVCGSCENDNKTREA